ncbi:MAG: hypothetical protein CFE38_16385 [Comamonadaceae bacterium PBBC1]|nr:MAG: hypothetical protein CFE38_16385 [Comamonadaceae bacterium PBBC1]
MDGLYGVGAKHSRAARITPCQLALLLIRQGMAYKPSPAGLAPTTMRSRDNGQWSALGVCPLWKLALQAIHPHKTANLAIASRAGSYNQTASQDVQPRHRQQGWFLQKRKPRDGVAF